MSRLAPTLALLLSPAVLAQTLVGFEPQVTATPVDGGVLLSWNALDGASRVVVRRQVPGEATSLIVANLDAGATSHFEPELPVGSRAVFRVSRQQAGGPPGEGIVLAGNDVPFLDDQGVALVVIDEDNAQRLRPALDAYEAALRDDGFEVQERTVARSARPPEVKAHLELALLLAGERRLTVVLLGAVPRAFSGIQFPDGHTDHNGAWPSDPYYADLAGQAYTDTLRGGVGAFHNDAGDGKFDQNFTSAVECAVGRVDFEGLPAFGPDAGTELLGRYLEKATRMRRGLEAPLRRALVRPNFGYFSGEAFGRAAYRDAPPIVGGPPQDSPFFPELEADGGYLLAWGDGAGGPTSAAGVTDTADLARRAPNVRFMGLFGSYFGDWSYPNALLRAALGSGQVVASLWYARPQVYLFALGALEPFGQAYARDQGFRYRPMPAYQGLLGDPTLRLFYPPALEGTAEVRAVDGGTQLSWSGTVPGALGYHVFRKLPGDQQAPERLSAAPVPASPFVDATAVPGTRYEWRVVGVVRERTGSGTFFNHSLGVRLLAEAPTLPTPDASVPTDGGPSTEPPPDAPGCGCSGGGVPGLSLLALPALLAWRRRRGRHW